MIEFNNVKVFTDNIDYAALDQLHTLDKTKVFEGQPIRLMPDAHAGAGCCIGFTVPIKDKVIPNLVGVDIACGMFVLEIGKIDLDLEKLDEVIHKVVPSGRNIGDRTLRAAQIIAKLRCYYDLKNLDWLESSLGTLGGGNHFIEVDQDEEGYKYLVIHSGSRNLGKQVAEIYQQKAIKHCRSIDTRGIIEKLKKEGRQIEIQETIAKLKVEKPKLPDALCYIEGEELEDYLYDMQICQDFANQNRQLMASNIVKAAGIAKKITGSSFTVLHNYIDTDRIIRKGAIYAGENARVLIPLNMRDGCILGVGKGNADWNYSAPHGAGRCMSRGEAKQQLSLEKFQETMKGIYSTTVSKDTIDEAPMAYKSSSEIIELVRDTINIEKIIKPVYNYKAAE